MPSGPVRWGQWLTQEQQDALLLRCIQNNDPEVLQQLFSRGVTEDLAGVEKRLGKSLLLTALDAVTLQLEQDVVLLIAKGADVRFKDDHGRTPLSTAIELKLLIAANAFIRHGAELKVDAPNYVAMVSATEARGLERRDQARVKQSARGIGSIHVLTTSMRA